MTEPQVIAVWVSVYAAFVGTGALVWQIIAWVRSRHPDVTVVARHESSGRGSKSKLGINVKVISNGDVTIVRAGIGPWQRGWKRHLFQLPVNGWSIDGQRWDRDADEVGRGLPRALRATSVLNIWYSEEEALSSGGSIGFKDGTDYIAWVQTSKGRIHRSNVFGGDGAEESWVKWC